MDPLRWYCPDCEQPLSCDWARRGKRGKCPRCGKRSEAPRGLPVRGTTGGRILWERDWKPGEADKALKDFLLKCHYETLKKYGPEEFARQYMRTGEEGSCGNSVKGPDVVIINYTAYADFTALEWLLL